MSMMVSPYAFAAAGGGAPAAKIVMVEVASNTSNGTQDITDAAISGATVKGVLFFYSQGTASKTFTSNMHLNVGGCDGTNQFALAYFTLTGATSSGAERPATYGKTDKCVLAVTSTGTVLSEAGFDSFITNGVRINWTTAPASAFKLFALLFAGADISVAAGSATHDNSPGVTVTTGFQPDAIVVASHNTGAFGAAVTDCRFSLGFAGWDDSAVLGAYSYAPDCRPVNGTSLRGSAFRTDGCAEDYDNGSSTWRANTISRTATSFTIQTNNDPSTDSFGYFAFKVANGEVKVGTLAVPTSTGNQAKTGVGFLPTNVLMIPQSIHTAAAAATAEKGTGFAYFDATDIVSVTYSHKDTSAALSAGNPTVEQNVYSNTNIYVMEEDGTALVEASFVSLDSDGWTLDFTDAAPAANLWPYLAIRAS